MADNTGVISIIGAESLLGRELVDVLSTAKLPAQVKRVSSVEHEETHSGILTEQEGEAVFLASLTAGELIGSRALLLAGSASSSAKVAEIVKSDEKPPVLVDLTGALEDNPTARLLAPMAGPSPASAPAPIYVIAHPAAIAMALFLKTLAKLGDIRQAVVVIFEPVSERGKKGLDELRQQTVGLLSFQKLKTDVFDTQVSFNMLPQYGSDAARSLEDVEGTVERHLATLLSSDPKIPMPSLKVVHAPVFHGHSFSVWVEFENRPADKALAAAFKSAGFDLRGKDEEPPSNVGVAGHSGVAIGGITADRNDPRACWFWLAADNLRISADNAAEVVRGILA